MKVEHLLYNDHESRKVALKVSERLGLPVDHFKVPNPILSSILKGTVLNQPPRTLLIGGNRWKHHYALNLTDWPMLILDAHSDMSYDEMILFRIPRPYNWVYFKLKRGGLVNLIIQPVKSLNRCDLTVPLECLKFFRFYAFEPSSKRVYITTSLFKRAPIRVGNPEAEVQENKLKISGKQVSVDWDITRVVHASRVLRLLDKVSVEGDTFDLWLDEGVNDINGIEDHVRYCIDIVKTLNYRSLRSHFTD